MSKNPSNNNLIPKHEAQVVAKKVKDEWAIDAQQVQILQNLSDSQTSAVFSGNWRGKTVAVKVPRTGGSVADADIQKIRAEVSSIRKMNHANLLPILAACLILPDLCYLVEYTPHGNLASQLFNPEIEMTAERSLKVAFDVSNGLVALHEAKPHLCHGNLKCSNIMVFATK
jgi:serine/threonine protein kinase